jgi:aquaporin Z
VIRGSATRSRRRRDPRSADGRRRRRLAVGEALGLTLIHLVSIPVTNTSVNPARSTGPALFAGAWALGQLWLFWLAPLLGGVVGGFLYRWLSTEAQPEITGGVRPANIG